MGHACVPTMYFQSGLGHRRSKQDYWLSKSGVRAQSRGTYGPPFGRARAILLYLTRKSAESGRTVHGSLQEIREMFGATWQLSNLAEHLQRLIGSWYARTLSTCSCGKCGHVRYLDVIREHSYCPKTHEFTIELGDDLIASKTKGFYYNAKHDLWIDELIRRDRFQALDLGLWCLWQMARKKRKAVDPFGPNGPFGFMPITKDENRRRGLLHQLYDALTAKGLWQRCPFRILGRGAKRIIQYAPWIQRDQRKQIAERARRQRARKTFTKAVRQMDAQSGSNSIRIQKKALEAQLDEIKNELDQMRGYLDGTRGPPR